MRSLRRSCVAGIPACVAAIGLASVAWACTPQAGFAITPRSGEAGATVSVAGERFGEGPVEVRWGRSSGPLLAVASGPTFATQVRVPSGAAARTHYIVALKRNADGSIEGSASASFVVTSTTAESAPPRSEGTQEAPGADTGGSSPVTPESSSTPSPAASSAESPAPPAPVSARQGTSSAPGRKGSERPAARPGSTPAAAAPGISPAAPAEIGVAASEFRPEPQTATAALPSARTVSGDVWGGFWESRPSVGPSLTDPPVGQNGGSLLPGSALMALGMLGVLSVGLLSLRQRRRATNPSSDCGQGPSLLG